MTTAESDQQFAVAPGAVEVRAWTPYTTGPFGFAQERTELLSASGFISSAQSLDFLGAEFFGVKVPQPFVRPSSFLHPRCSA